MILLIKLLHVIKQNTSALSIAKLCNITRQYFDTERAILTFVIIYFATMLYSTYLCDNNSYNYLRFNYVNWNVWIIIFHIFFIIRSIIISKTGVSSL